MENKINKLVRDYIPKLIEKEGKTYKAYELSEKEFELALQGKLLEESLELLKAKTYDEQVEELADCISVLLHFAIHYNLEPEDILEKWMQKTSEKGGFFNKTFLESYNDFR